MRREIHPEYREVVFHDNSCNEYFLIRSTVQTDRTVEFEGKTYPYVGLEISSKSHPYYTGEQRAIKSEGRIARFNKRLEKMKK